MTLDLKEASVLRVQEGDVVVLRVPGHLTPAQRSDTGEQLVDLFAGQGVDVLILEGGVSIEVLRKET